MPDIAQEIRFKIDLDADLMKRSQSGILMHNDKNANKLVIEVTRKSYTEPVSLDGISVFAEFVRQSSDRVPLIGTVSGNEASILLDEHCYVEPGEFEIFVRFKSDDIIRTILYIRGNVSKDADGPIVDTENVVLSLDELLAQIEEMKRATARADEAAIRADDAVYKASIALQETNDAVQDARNAAREANSARIDAKTAAEGANTAASGANNAKDTAYAAAENANTATQSAKDATQSAKDATQSASAAATSANAAATAANNAAHGIDATIDTRLGGLSFAVNERDGGLDIIYNY